MTDDEKYSWIAINGPSCASTLIAALPQPKVSPTPEIMLGFPTRQEAADAQHLCLNAPIKTVQRGLKEWKDRPDVKVVTPDAPEPPSHTTSWIV